MSRFACLQIRITCSQSITPSPQAHPTVVPVTLPRSLQNCCSENVFGVQMDEAIDDAFKP